MRMIVAVTLLALLAVPAFAEDFPVVLVDFDKGKPTDGWHSSGLTLKEASVEPMKTVSCIRALTMVGVDDKETRVGYIFRPVEVKDWRKFRAFSLHAKVEATQPIEMRIIAWDGRGSRGMVRRFRLDPGDWTEVVLPLPTWREVKWDFVGDFRQVTGMELRWDEGSGSVTIDDIRLLPGERGILSCRPTMKMITDIGFPEGKTKTLESDHFRVVTNALRFKGKEGPKLVARLERVPVVLENSWGLSGAADEPVPFLVFRKVEQFRDFIPFYGKAFGWKCSAPAGDCGMIFGVVACTWTADHGWQKPSYVYEAAHSIIRQRLGLTSNGNWVQQGLAYAVQVRLYPDSWGSDTLKKRFAAFEAGEGPWQPWAKLMMTKLPGVECYDQLATIMTFLNSKYREELPGFWDLLRESEEKVSKNAADLLSAAMGKTIAELEAEWLAWGKIAYTGK